MTTDDLPQFTTLLDSVCTMLSKGQYTPNETSTALWFNVLAPFPLPVVRAALDQHLRTSRFPPTPAEILELIGGNDGRPGAEEAWALVLRDRDDGSRSRLRKVAWTEEVSTTVWTREMLAAWGVANPVLTSGDEVGARMAFREVYNREVELAHRRCEPVRWEVSLGTDKQAAAEVIRAALADGRIVLPAIGSPGDELTLLLENASLPRRLALPAPEPGDTEVARAGKAALTVAVERMRNPPAVSADQEARAATAAAAALAQDQAIAYAAERGIVLDIKPAAAPVHAESTEEPAR